jgi:hypothetical protein
MNTSRTSTDIHTIIPPDAGDPFRFGEVGGRFKIGGVSTDERFAVAQLPEIPPACWPPRSTATATKTSIHTC